MPLGTIAKDADSGEFLFEITQHGETQVLMKGGRGGLRITSYNVCYTKLLRMLHNY